MRRNLGFGLISAGILAVATCTALAAEASEFRVLKAEPVGLRATDVPARATSAPVHLHFQAQGQSFELVLSSNERLLANLPVAQKAALADHALYRGVIAGRPDSWVRLTRVGDELHGAFYDGRDLYTIAPARDVAPFALQSLDADGSEAVVYRLADTESVLNSAFCGTGAAHGLQHSAAAAENPQKAHDAIVGELRAVAAAVAVEQIEIAFIADFEFSTRFASDTQGAMLARINIIDGIFDAQVGVAIVPFFQIFRENDDPFTASDSSNLLDQVANYRRDTPAIRSRGLAHLMTGRGLDGNTAGVAFVDTLCQARGGSGLSESTASTTTSALIASHEIGHNFGAPHDGEAGPACESTPATFLMAPSITGSNQFSQCSLDQMAPNVAGAACITPIAIADAALALPGGTITAARATAFNLNIDVNSPGTTQVNSVAVIATPSASLGVDSASAAGGTCTTGANSVVTCDLGSIASGASKRVTLVLRGNTAGSANLSVNLTAANDANSGNNNGTQAISITSATAPAPPPPSNDDGGGGMGLLTTAVIGLALLLRLRRRGPRDATY